MIYIKGDEKMGFTYKRQINYYETDKMGIVHHSNYIRFMEEARTAWMESVGMPFWAMEEAGITIPVLGLNIDYKNHVTFGDTILISPYLKEFNGVRMTVGYNVTEEKTGKTVVEVETRHCFTGHNLRPVNLKKKAPEFYEVFIKMLEGK